MVERVRLKCLSYEVEPVSIKETRLPVVAQGFGENMKEFRFGFLCAQSRNTFSVSFKDVYGEYTEVYSKFSGTRLQDIGSPDGWRISLSELRRKPVKPTIPKGATVKKLYEEEHSFDNSEFKQSLVCQVWVDVHSGERFLRVFRRKQKILERSEGKKLHISEAPGVVSFERIVGILGMFLEVPQEQEIGL